MTTRWIILILIALYVFSCSPPSTGTIPTESELVDIWENGRPKTVKLFTIIDGEREAVREIHYHIDGAKAMEGPLLNNKREGLWQSWYEDGSLWSEGTYRNGKRHGRAVVFYPNGKTMLEGMYEEDKRVGLWRSYDEDGRLINEVRQ
jgi:antitoxin component YwqK of YwqJK toxin-antitoxin module